MVSSLPQQQINTTTIICFHLVIEVLLVSRTRSLTKHGSSEQRFHLVIEVLLVSSVRMILPPSANGQFPSRNRGAFGFKTKYIPYKPMSVNQFPSRNRDAFGFKMMNFSVKSGKSEGFHLVIEVLLVSSFSEDAIGALGDYQKFPSRNRGAFGFKGTTMNFQTIYKESVSIS